MSKPAIGSPQSVLVRNALRSALPQQLLFFPLAAAATALSLILALLLVGLLLGAPQSEQAPQNYLPLELGDRGGLVTFGQRTEARTLNPLVATDMSSKQVLGLLNSDLIHINRLTQSTEPALAESWKISPDLREYILKIRAGIRFSDGQPFTADDVLFTFQVLLDKSVHSPQRDLLVLAGKPLQVSKVGYDSVRFLLPAPYAAAERLFDSVYILPRHILRGIYKAGGLGKAWPLTVQPNAIAGLGPFRLRQYLPGERIRFERNPYFWKRDRRGSSLPYLDEVDSVTTGGSQGEAMRFGAGETDFADPLSPADYLSLKRYESSRHLRLLDLGPGLEFDFLFFNLNALQSADHALSPELQKTFHNLAFRNAVASAIDRPSLVKIAFQGRAYPLGTFVPPGDIRWIDRAILAWPPSDGQARQFLRAAGFGWNSQGQLLFGSGRPLRFSLAYNAGNSQRELMATLIQQDLQKVGMEVNLVALESRSLLDRVFRTFDYEAAIMALAGNDTDPNSEINIWSSQGGTHLWDLTQNEAGAPWQKEIDRLMEAQMTTSDYRKRKLLYDRVQELVRSNLPIVTLVSPHVLVGAKDFIANYHPAILADHNLWNAEYLFIRRRESRPDNQRR